jgi:hypothetical protein
MNDMVSMRKMRLGSEDGAEVVFAGFGSGDFVLGGKVLV